MRCQGYRICDRIDQQLERIAGTNQEPDPQPKPAGDRAVYRKLHDALIALSPLDPQPRGYGFEKFLTKMFNSFSLNARGSFRLIGEQIDGSFELNGQTYLVEAKWQNQQTAVKDLHGFHAKIGEKAAWTRGLFVSYIGFSEDGLKAFGRAKNIICMDGFDLSETLGRELPLDVVLERKVRHAAETEQAFARVRDLSQSSVSATGTSSSTSAFAIKLPGIQATYPRTRPAPAVRSLCVARSLYIPASHHMGDINAKSNSSRACQQALPLDACSDLKSS